MGPCVDFQAFKGASPAMAMAPAGSLCVAVQRCHPAAHGMMHSFRYLKEARLWSSAQQLRSSSSTGSWREIASSNRRAVGPIMATAKVATGEVGSEDGGQYSEKPSVAVSPPKPEVTESKPSEEANAAARPPKPETAESKPNEEPSAEASPPKPEVAESKPSEEANATASLPNPEATEAKPVEKPTEEKPSIEKPSAEASPPKPGATESKSVEKSTKEKPTTEKPSAEASAEKPETAEPKSNEEPKAEASPAKPKAAASPSKPKAAASPSKPKAAESKATEKPGAATSPPKPKVAAAGGAKKAGKAAKAVAKALPEAMAEDIIPKLTASLEKERGVSDLEIQFVDNQLQGSFVKNQVPYNFWAYFPDGKLEGSRGFSLSSHGSPPSTVEPFLIDEKISSELVVQQIIKRLFAQKLLATN